MDGAKIIDVLFRGISVLLIPGMFLLARSVKNQTIIKSDIANIKKYIAIICDRANPKIPCIFGDDPKEG